MRLQQGQSWSKLNYLQKDLLHQCPLGGEGAALLACKGEGPSNFCDKAAEPRKVRELITTSKPRVL